MAVVLFKWHEQDARASGGITKQKFKDFFNKNVAAL
jgi:hypothetical protein